VGEACEYDAEAEKVPAEYDVQGGPEVSLS
jgi:hypothetical protein